MYTVCNELTKNSKIYPGISIYLLVDKQQFKQIVLVVRDRDRETYDYD